MPNDIRDVGAAILRALAAVEAGAVTPAQAGAIAALASAYVKLHGAAETEKAIADLEQRVALAEVDAAARRRRYE